MILFEIVPETEEDGTCILAAIGQLQDAGVDVQVDLPWVGASDLDGPQRFCDALASTGFSGHAVVGGKRFEFANGAVREDGWQHKTVQIELRISPREEADLAMAIRAMGELGRRPDVSDLDASNATGLLHVLVCVRDPEPFLEAAHAALVSVGFRGDAQMGAKGRWHFGDGAPTRLDEGVRI